MHITVMTVHIVAGALGLVTGFVALYATKGASLHRSGGTLFVYAMLTMAMLGTAIAIVWGPAASINVPAGLLTTYLVMTGLTTVRTRPGARWLDLGLLLIALGVAMSMLWLGIGALSRGKSMGLAIPAFIFTTIALLGSAGDVRVLRSGALKGAPRLARHLWRMCTALMIASLSFSVRLPRLLPKPLRTPVVYSLPTLLVLVTMLYWLWRVRSKRSPRGIVVAAPGGHLVTKTA
jgi:hypothetical protein